MGGQHPIHWGPTEQKCEGGERVVPQSVWAVSWVFSRTPNGILCHLFPGSQVFRFGLNYIPLARLDLQLADNRSWNFSASANIMRVNSYTYTHTCVCVYTMFTVLKSIQHTYIECLLLSRQCLNLPCPHGAIYFSFVDCSGLQDNRAKQHYCPIICIYYWLCSLEKSDFHPRLYDYMIWLFQKISPDIPS